MKFYNGKRGLAIAYAGLFSFFLFFSLPIGGVFLTLNDGETFTKLNQIISNKPSEISGAAGQFQLVFYFIIFMVLLTGFMYLLTAKSRELAFRFFSITFGIYTVAAFGFKVMITSAMTISIEKLAEGQLKAEAPTVVKSFVNNFLLFGMAGAILSTIALLLGLLGRGNKES